MAATKKATKTTKRTAKTTKKGKKTTKAKSTATKVTGFERDHDLPWCPKKVAIFKAMKALRATTAGAAKGTGDIAEKAKVSDRDVRHYCYHARAAGLVGIANVEEVRGYAFYLTAKGSKIKPVLEKPTKTKK